MSEMIYTKKQVEAADERACSRLRAGEVVPFGAGTSPYPRCDLIIEELGTMPWDDEWTQGFTTQQIVSAYLYGHSKWCFHPDREAVQDTRVYMLGMLEALTRDE